METIEIAGLFRMCFGALLALALFLSVWRMRRDTNPLTRALLLFMMVMGANFFQHAIFGYAGYVDSQKENKALWTYLFVTTVPLIITGFAAYINLVRQWRNFFGS